MSKVELRVAMKLQEEYMWKLTRMTEDLFVNLKIDQLVKLGQPDEKK